MRFLKEAVANKRGLLVSKTLGERAGGKALAVTAASKEAAIGGAVVLGRGQPFVVVVAAVVGVGVGVYFQRRGRLERVVVSAGRVACGRAEEMVGPARGGAANCEAWVVAVFGVLGAPAQFEHHAAFGREVVVECVGAARNDNWGPVAPVRKTKQWSFCVGSIIQWGPQPRRFVFTLGGMWVWSLGTAFLVSIWLSLAGVSGLAGVELTLARREDRREEALASLGESWSFNAATSALSRARPVLTSSTLGWDEIGWPAG